MTRIGTRLASASLVILGLAAFGCTAQTPVQPDTGQVLAPAGSEGVSAAAQGSGGRPPFVFPSGCCFYQDRVVRTVVPPAASPQEGVDNFYGFAAGASGQLGVVAVAPGNTDYHGGHWAFFRVDFNVVPFVLSSEAAILAAQTAGQVTVTRVPARDFKCPIQP
jgi:hypothetical protein